MDRELIVAVSDLTCRYAGAPRDALVAVSLEVRAGEFHALLGRQRQRQDHAAARGARPRPTHSGTGRDPRSRGAGLVSPGSGARGGVVPQREENCSRSGCMRRYCWAVTRTSRCSAACAPRIAPPSSGRCSRATRWAWPDRWLWTLSGASTSGSGSRARSPRNPSCSCSTTHHVARPATRDGAVRAGARAGGHPRARRAHDHSPRHLAARFADQVLILAEARAVARGAPADVLTRETVERVFSWPVAIEPFDGRPQMIPLRRHLS